MRIAIAQLNPIVGDVAGNTSLILDAINQAQDQSCDVLVTSELVLIGYPPRDLLLREGVVESCERAMQQIANAAGEMFVLVGHPRRVHGRKRPFANSVSVCHNGRVIAVADKQLLPGYDVFDEDRYFEPGAQTCVLDIAGTKCGVLVCEDLWRAKDVNARTRYDVEPVKELVDHKAELIFSLNASPFVSGKWKRHIDQLRDVARQVGAPVIAVNQVGGNDDLVFDGRSVVVDSQGAVCSTLAAFQSDLKVIDVAMDSGGRCQMNGKPADDSVAQWANSSRELFHALVLGMRDYIRKTGHTDVFLGLSGGIDSALTAALAVAAVGSKHVHGVMMPSRHSSAGSLEDSRELARRLTMATCTEASIKDVHNAMSLAIRPLAGDRDAGIADENVQARLRGIMLMAASNSHPKSLVLATSNKSEIATGYCTLYGDMCGALAPLGDVLKTRIYELSRWINAYYSECGFSQPPIPESSLTKPPSAELRPNQTDQDTLPPYEVLDQIVERYIDREQSLASIAAETGIDESVVRRWTRTIDQMQYKRDQAAVILKVSPRAFGRGRPMPIVMKQSAAVSPQPARTAADSSAETADVVKLTAEC